MSEIVGTIELNREQAEALLNALDDRITACEEQLKRVGGAKDFYEYWQKQIALSQDAAVKIRGYLD